MVVVRSIRRQSVSVLSIKTVYFYRKESFSWSFQQRKSRHDDDDEDDDDLGTELHKVCVGQGWPSSEETKRDRQALDSKPIPDWDS
jgi:hypothetical protein